MAVWFLILGIVFVLIGFRSLWLVVSRRRRWKRYQGEVVDYVWERTAGSDLQFWMLRWVDEHGVARTAKNPTGSSGGTLRSFPFPVEVLVDPDNPEKAQVAKGGNSGVAAGIATLFVGLVFTGVGTLISVAS